MKLLIALPIKASNDVLLQEGRHYIERLRLPLTAQTIFCAKKHSLGESHKEKRMREEGSSLLKHTDACYRVALDERGRKLSSVQFADFIQKQYHHSAKKIAFLIGGAFGLSPEVTSSCDMSISLSSMTLPHRLAYLLLCEQIYRAGEIIGRTPYHK